MNYKICTKCKQKKPATNEYFYNHPTCKNGLCSQCKYCRNEYKKKYRKKSRGNKLTYDELKRLLHYDPITGVWTWKISRGKTSKGDIAGTISNDGYRRISIYEISYNASVLAFLYMEGYMPENDVDHINRVRDDDRWVNLRHVTRQCNTRNTTLSSGNTSGITGISFHKLTKKWMAEITNNYKKEYLGVFDSKEEAAFARYQAELKNGWATCNIDSSAGKYLKAKGYDI